MRFLVLLFSVVLLSLPTPAFAHAIGLSRGEYALHGGTLDATLTFARADALSLVPSLDADKDGVLTAAELSLGRADFSRGVLDRVVATVAGVRCLGVLGDARLTDGDGVAVPLTYECAGNVVAVDLAMDPLFAELSRGHRHLAHIAGHGDSVLFEGSSACHVPQGPLANASATPAPGGAASESAGSGASMMRALSIFRMGVEHILTGYDHLLFLFGLVLVAHRWRSLLPVVTAFTIAHSLTLGVAALGWWTPPSRIVEPLIALSIAYVGIENLFMKDAGRRWRITFPFGLIHGFGFASALRELNLPTREVPVALVSFNLGVEAGQLAVLAVMVPILVAIRQRRWFESPRIPSLGVAAIGAVWFVARIV